MALRRFTKQFIVASIFLLLLAGLAGILYTATREQPSCFDGIQNQDEEGVDCGGVCLLVCKKESLFQELSVRRVVLIPTVGSFYDVMAEVENKNLDFSAPSFDYTFSLFDASSSVVVSRRGNSYILPGERMIIVEQRLDSKSSVTSAKFLVSDVAWEETKDYPRLVLDIRNRSFQENPPRASGVVVNRTGLDFQQVDVTVLLKDALGNVVAVGRTDVRTLRDGEQRHFEVEWPPGPPRRISRVEMEARTNILSDENILAPYDTERRERFQIEVPEPTGGRRRF